jgi:hypothetical protein
MASVICALIMPIVGIIMLNIKLNPIWWENEEIKDLMFEKIPLGASMDEAIETMQNNHWEIRRISDSGYYIQDGRPYFNVNSDANFFNVCSKTIRVTLGHYPLNSGVVIVYFGFDDDGYLVDITVYKEYNSL